MPLFMDVHSPDGGVAADDVATAHRKDLETQARYGVRYLRCGVDESAGRIFWLVEADCAEDAATLLGLARSKGPGASQRSTRPKARKRSSAVLIDTVKPGRRGSGR